MWLRQILYLFTLWCDSRLEANSIAQLRKELQAAVAHQQKQIEALTTGLQKVSAQLEASKPAPQVVNNP